MRLYLDCEFNEFGGELISMAIVAEDGSEFYEVLPCENPGPWVAQNVIPVLNKDAVPRYLFKAKLFAFLNWFDDIHIVVDWPDDIKYFCNELITAPGEMMAVPKFTCEMNRHLSNKRSKILHNALEDARAIMEADINSKYQ